MERLEKRYKQMAGKDKVVDAQLIEYLAIDFCNIAVDLAAVAHAQKKNYLVIDILDMADEIAAWQGMDLPIGE